MTTRFFVSWQDAHGFTHEVQMGSLATQIALVHALQNSNVVTSSTAAIKSPAPRDPMHARTATDYEG